MRKRPSASRKHMVGKFGFDILSLWLLDSFGPVLSSGLVANYSSGVTCHNGAEVLTRGTASSRRNLGKKMKVKFRLYFPNFVLTMIFYKDCERGDRIKLTQFIADNKDELLEAYSRLTFAQRHAYNAEVLEARAQKRHIARANPKAKHHDINATFIGMDREVSQGLILSCCWLTYI